ncbi:MAG: thioredoxin family protein [Nostocaceae cyanobacterium]|nr:thioredoxin family protein [Nostocaceae cyanobacterium]
MTANSPPPTVTSPGTSEVPTAVRVRNFVIAMVAIILSVALFFGLKTETASVSLEKLDEQSTPLEVALTNGKPSLMEFYANWCTVCQAMAPDIAQLKQEYGDKVNFVMLNVDNTKWLPEMLRYRVDGIPHFVYMTKDGESLAQAIGEQPRTIMASNLQALVAGSPLPHTQAKGEASKFAAPVTPNASTDDPRSHGSQVKS